VVCESGSLKIGETLKQERSVVDLERRTKADLTLHVDQELSLEE
jgi:hypothetical protein